MFDILYLFLLFFLLLFLTTPVLFLILVLVGHFILGSDVGPKPFEHVPAQVGNDKPVYMPEIKVRVPDVMSVWIEEGDKAVESHYIIVVLECFRGQLELPALEDLHVSHVVESTDEDTKKVVPNRDAFG